MNTCESCCCLRSANARTPVRPAAVEDGHYLARSGGGMCEEEDQQLLTGPQGVKTLHQLLTGPQGVKTFQ
jgi:hypothetical protein